MLSEGSGQNVFVVSGGTLYTPPVNGTLLAGITRDSILTLAGDLGIPVREQPIPREMLYGADEIFLTGTASEVTPVRSVDKITIGRGTPRPDHGADPAPLPRRRERPRRTTRTAGSRTCATT